MEVILEALWGAKVSVTAFMVDRLRVLAASRIGHPRPRLGGKKDELVDSEKGFDNPSRYEQSVR
jgi:hypothetical protein